MYRIFIVEDDNTIAQQVCRHIRTWGLEAACAEDFHNVLEEFHQYDPQLVLMDISLPFYDGYHWCQLIRQESQVPVMFLSSMSDNMNIIMAMNMGGDDFIAKPFDLSVLIAKIQALLRRTYDFCIQPPALEWRGVQLHPSDNRLDFNGQQLELSRNEHRILLTLMERPGQIVSRERLMERLWETDCFIDENTLTVNVARLRKKLERIGLTDFIATRKGQGYLLEEGK